MLSVICEQVRVGEAMSVDRVGRFVVWWIVMCGDVGATEVWMCCDVLYLVRGLMLTVWRQVA